MQTPPGFLPLFQGRWHLSGAEDPRRLRAGENSREAANFSDAGWLRITTGRPLIAAESARSRHGPRVHALAPELPLPSHDEQNERIASPAYRTCHDPSMDLSPWNARGDL